MSRTLGVDHGTRGIRFCLLDGLDTRFFEVSRNEVEVTSITGLLEKQGFLDVDLIGLTYSMADAINRITNIDRVKNRGQVETVTGEYVGGGTRLFDEISGSKIKAVLIPGLHRGIDCIDSRFKLLYSHMAASEKTALAYHAFNQVNRESDVESMIIADISSNTVTIGIKDGKFFGAVDACLGASGLLHGPLDLSAIRRVDSGGVSANKAFYSAGVSQKAGLESEDILNGRSGEERLARDTLIMAAEMEISGLAAIVEPQAIAIAGSAGIHKNIYPKLEKKLGKIAPVTRLDANSAAMGAAEIARDIQLGKKDFLGIGVDL
ncbi:MAG TPA: methanogenesis marker 12 protein [Euryarchaeota archaeon]|nr:hypothetical protein BMS3Bbin16_01250 [archaeon BMS3Bbin16]HDH28504.1 methanogenesis marker 12 protein [Euryarchaeota archaeon]